MVRDKKTFPKVAEGQAFLSELARLNESKILSAGSKVWLGRLFDLTLAGDDEALEIRNLAREFADETKFNTVSAAISKLRDHLDLHYASPLADKTMRLYVNQRPCSVGYERAKKSVPPRQTIHDLLEESHGITVDDFKSFLIQLCELDDISDEERNRRASQFLGNNAALVDIPVTPGRAFEQLFKHYVKRGQLKLSEMFVLAEAFHIHPIMFDPLLSKELDSGSISIEFPKATTDEEELNADILETSSSPSSRNHQLTSFVPANRAKEKGYGEKAWYHIPNGRLSGTDASLVYLILRPTSQEEDGDAPRSDDHHHPGDEWMFVLRGAIEVRFADSGVRTRLEGRSYIHFYAEQTHSAHFLHGEGGIEEAHVLVIRQYQRVSNRSSRQSMRQLLWKGIGEELVAEGLDPLLHGWIIETAATRSIKAGYDLPPKEIANRLGLARFLWDFPVTPSGSPIDRKRRDNIARGSDRVLYAEIPDIQQQFGLFPLLLWDFLFPCVPREIVVLEHAKDKKHSGKSHWVNLARVTDERTKSAFLSDEVIYRVPSRTLAGSDLSIAWIELSPGWRTPVNSHSGSELLIPLEGRLALGIEKTIVCNLSPESGLAHYRAQKKHWIQNTGSSRAKMLVIRFLGDCPNVDPGSSPLHTTMPIPKGPKKRTDTKTSKPRR